MILYPHSKFHLNGACSCMRHYMQLSYSQKVIFNAASIRYQFVNGSSSRRSRVQLTAQYITQLFVQHVSAGLCEPQPPMPRISCTRRPRLFVPATKKQYATALVVLPWQDQLRGTRCRHHSAMTNTALSLHFAVYSRLNFLPQHTTLL